MGGLPPAAARPVRRHPVTLSGTPFTESIDPMLPAAFPQAADAAAEILQAP